MLKKSFYIKPAIEYYISFEEALSKYLEGYQDFFTKEDKWELKDILSFPKTFVVAEPGYGKTRLLEEIVVESEKEGLKPVFIEAKKISVETAEDSILKQLNVCLEAKSSGSKVKNEKNQIVCIDALDEVKLEDFSKIVEKIKVFLNHYNKVTTIISCRWHFFRKYEELFSDIDFRFARILPFSTEQVKAYLKYNSIQQENIDEIFNTLSFRDRILVIQTPRYLELLVEYIKDKGIENSSEITRENLFEYFIYKKLELEDKNLNKQKRDLIKRVLEKLALIMEIYQANLLNKDELMSFFDDLQSDLKVSLLHQIPIEVFFDKTLLKDNIDTIEFDNTEFQEYLAAKEIIRLGKNIKIIYDLSVDHEIREIYPSWFNTLGFVLDLDISILKPLLDFARIGKEKITQDEEYHRFLTRINVEHLTLEVRKEIFEHIFIYYQSVQYWIDPDIARNLSYCFDMSQLNLIKYYIDGRRFKKTESNRYVCLSNIVQILGFLFERDIFDNIEKEFWKRKLIKYINHKTESGVLKRQALFALGNLGDDKVIKKIENIWESTDKLVKDSFLEFCRKINPNHKLSLKYFIEGTKQESIYARYGLYEIVKVQAIIKLLETFISDAKFFIKFVDQESIFKDDDFKLIENIKLVCNNDIESKLKNIVLKGFEQRILYHTKDSKFIKSIALALKEKNKDYIFDLITQIEQSENLQKHLYDFYDLFSILLEKEQVKDFIRKLNNFEYGNKDALQILQNIKFTKRSDAEDIYEEGRSFFKSEYKEAEKTWKQLDQKASEQERVYSEFKIKLEPKKGEYSPAVFKFYLNNKDILSSMMTEEEKRRLINLIENSVFDKFDPGKHDLTITNEEGQSRTYKTHAWIHIFGDCIQVASDIKLDITKYRNNIVNYIPFAYHKHLESIFSLVKNLNKNEIKNLLVVYKNKISDLWRFRPASLIDASKKYIIKDSVPILREFIAQKEIPIFERISSLIASEFLKPDVHFLNDIFDKFKDEVKLIEKANELLIVNHKDEKAIDWRFEELARRVFSYKQPSGFHKLSPQEIELNDKEFASSLMRLKDMKYQNKFLNLLAKSFEIYKKEEHWYYVQYLWGIVCGYFDTLKEEKSYTPLNNLEKFIEEHSSEKGINWLKYRLKELKRSYINFLGKPSSVNICIQKYNNLKTQQYNDITTPYDLNEITKEIIDNDIRLWVESEGAYSFILGEKVFKSKRQDYENLIQKTIVAKIEGSFWKRGIEVRNIIREPQQLDDKRVDLHVSYGFVGPILIEIKLSNSTELSGSVETLKRKTSYKSLNRYMKSFGAQYGIFLVFDNKQRANRSGKWETHFKKIKEAYKDIENITVLGLRCAPSL